MPDFDPSVPRIARACCYRLGAKGKLRRRPGTRRADHAGLPEPGVLRALELVEPGVVRVSKWRPGSEREAAQPTGLWGGVARTP